MIPVNRPLITSRDEELLVECIRSGWLSGEGPYIERFESDLARSTRRRYAVLVSNGTIALEIALRALNITQGDEVIIPTFSIISLALAVIRVGATPIVVDACESTWTMNTDEVRGRLTSRTKAVIAMHTYGLAVHISPLAALCEERGIALIEDAAEALGSSYEGKPCGSFGAVSTVSFYANKNVSTGEGGAILTDDAAVAERCRSLRNLCFNPSQRFVHEELGYNARLSSLQAALGIAQLERVEETRARKVEIAHAYLNALANLEKISFQSSRTDYTTNDYWIVGLVLDPALGVTNQEAISALAKNGVGSRPFFWCVHEQPALKGYQSLKGVRLSVAEKLARFGLYLPSGAGITDDEVLAVCTVFKDLYSSWNRSQT